MKRRGLVIGAAVVVVAVIIGAAHRGPVGQPSPDAAVNEYVAALGVSDRDRLRHLADPDHSANAEIDARIQRLGAGRLQVTKTDIGGTADSALRPATLTGKLDGAPYSDTLQLSRHGTKWYVILGPAKDASSKS